MNKFDIFLEYINNKITNFNIKNITNQLIKSWFISLNQKDIKVLTIVGSFLVQRICELFMDDYSSQLINNNYQDLKAIILLFLPYINDDNPNVYKNIKDLNELILTDKITPDILKLERSEVLKSHFKFTNMGLGLFDINQKLDLDDDQFEKLIYKIIYHNFISLIDTLAIVNGKLYVNWINIIPLNLKNYENSRIYKNTIKEKELNSSIDKFSYNGLYTGEFYNVYRNIFYESIKKVKWLIFIFNGEYIIQYLNKIFNFNNFFESYSFEDLNDKEKNKFNTQLKNITDYSIWKNIIVWFVNNYTKIKLILNKEILEPFKMEIKSDGKDGELIRESRNKFNNISNEQIKNFIDNINPSHIWNFIKESLDIFESTIYAKYLIKDNKIKTELYLPETKINLKNIYNISKALSHNNLKDWDLLPIKYSSLYPGEKEDFWKRFNNKIPNQDWIQLRNNLKLEGYDNYNDRINEILDDFKKIKNKLVWEYLVYNGLLSDFKVNILDSENIFKKHIKTELDKQDYKESYYYLTNKKYSEHNFRVGSEDTSYLKNIKKEKWYSFYAMNWICQINFYQHYLNHRVLYITGATGQGKSTQVPKLLMYALKMLDYKNNGKVVCTQPRIGPTNTVSNSVSQQLGVPIYEYSISLKELIKSDKYYVQFKHSDDNHTNDLVNHLSLKFVTDGTLLTEIINNPILKEETISSKSESIYTDKNKYDVMIIDEAHEHNTNMDLILTLARQSCYMNNDLKLIIMSATMDDDEPNFRRYYNIINDNLVYPIKSLDDYELLYDSIYLDRRFHIAPPGKGTQHDIKEIYLENGNTEDIVKNIIESSIFGDILVFENGTSDIMKRVKSLNKITPNNVIVIPYFGTGLNKKYKDIIEDLKTMISKIRTAKHLVDTTWNENYKISTDVPEGTYNRAIVVATNVAEASITIENLKFVIDNGFAKVNQYNEITDEQQLIEEPISEASRKQRKGRVGRVASGTVYYLYKKGEKESIKSKYKITQENFGENLLKLLQTRKLNEENLPLVLIGFDPNVPDNFIKKPTDNDFMDSVYYKKQIHKIQHQQFYVEQYKLYWDEKYFVHNKINEFMNIYESGYNIETLCDLKGEFYIIHPKENIIKRNILGNIIGYYDNKNNFKKNNSLEDNILRNLIINQSYKYFLVDKTTKIYNQTNNFIIDNKMLYKTEFFEYVNKIRELIDSNDFGTPEYITLLTSQAYGSFNEVLEVLSMLKVINNSMKNLIINMKLYNNQDSEIEFIYNIIEEFKKKFYYFNIFSIKNNLKLKYSSVVDKKIEVYLNDRKKDKKDPPPNKYTAKEWNKLNQLYLTGRLKNGFDSLISDLIEKDYMINNFENYIDEINNWAEFNNIKGSALIQFLYTYKKFYLNFMTMKKNDPNNLELDPLKKMNEEESSSFKKSLSCTNKYEKIIRPFLHGRPFNFALRMKSSDNFHTTIPPTPLINNDSKANISNILFYFNKKENDMSITNKIEIDWLFNVLPIYYKPSNFKNIILKRDGDEIKQLFLDGDIFNDFCVSLRNKWSSNNLPFESSEGEILREFIKNIKINLQKN